MWILGSKEDWTYWIFVISDFSGFLYTLEKHLSFLFGDITHLPRVYSFGGKYGKDGGDDPPSATLLLPWGRLQDLHLASQNLYSQTVALEWVEWVNGWRESLEIMYIAVVGENGVLSGPFCKCPDSVFLMSQTSGCHFFSLFPLLVILQLQLNQRGSKCLLLNFFILNKAEVTFTACIQEL